MRLLTSVSAEIKNEGNFTSVPTIRLCGMDGNSFAPERAEVRVKCPQLSSDIDLNCTLRTRRFVQRV